MPPNSSEHPYRRRLMLWREINPNWTIYLWSDLEGRDRQQMLQWCGNLNITLHSPKDIPMGPGEKVIFEEECNRHFYVTASDLLRLRVLYQFGGFYVDFDVLPRTLPTGTLPLGIAMLLRNWDGKLAAVTPHAIASYPAHPLLQMALWEAESNFKLLENFPDQDFRNHEDPSYRYGSALALTGDLFRPALALCAGVLPVEGFPWTAWLDVMQLGIPIEHLEDNSWLYGDRPSEKIYPSVFMDAQKERLSRQRHYPVTSVLHIAAAYGGSKLIGYAKQSVAPFEDYFGHTPRGIAQIHQRNASIMDLIPSV
jgi:hypothetical protein